MTSITLHDLNRATDVSENDLDALWDEVRTDLDSDAGRTYHRVLAFRLAVKHGFHMAGDGEPAYEAGKFVAQDYAAYLKSERRPKGVAKSTVSLWNVLSIAVDRGITPENDDKNRVRFHAIVQHYRKSIGQALRAKPYTVKAVDAAIREAQERDFAQADQRKTDSAEERANRATQPDESDAATVDDVPSGKAALTAIDDAFRDWDRTVEAGKATDRQKLAYAATVEKRYAALHPATAETETVDA